MNRTSKVRIYFSATKFLLKYIVNRRRLFDSVAAPDGC